MVAAQGAGVVTRSVVAVGTFDGVHRGHQALLNAMRREAEARGARVAVVTFDPPPRMVLRPDPAYQLLTSLDERVELLRRFGADEVVVQTFDMALAARSAEQFCRDLVERVGMVTLVGGPDLALGHRRHGTPEELREIGGRLGFDVVLLDQLTVGGEPIRSGAIRRALRAGELAHANELLGHPATLAGTVVHGDHRGRTIGVPTANLDVPPERLVPAHGVYAVRADGKPGVMNVGTRPTVDGTRRTIEVHLLDWEGDLYGRELRVELVERLRDEQRFASLDALVEQIGLDAQAARRALGV
jgi:riboflavin kinase/FMN adenylyltransferase